MIRRAMERNGTQWDYAPPFDATKAVRPMSLDAIARASGTFAMVAMDQRESLRTMIAAATTPDERLVAFKTAVARELGPHCSGLPDRPAVRLGRGRGRAPERA